MPTCAKLFPASGHLLMLLPLSGLVIFESFKGRVLFCPSDSRCQVIFSERSSMTALSNLHSQLFSITLSHRSFAHRAQEDICNVYAQPRTPIKIYKQLSKSVRQTTYWKMGKRLRGPPKEAIQNG